MLGFVLKAQTLKRLFLTRSFLHLSTQSSQRKAYESSTKRLVLFRIVLKKMSFRYSVYIILTGNGRNGFDHCTRCDCLISIVRRFRGNYRIDQIRDALDEAFPDAEENMLFLSCSDRMYPLRIFCRFFLRPPWLPGGRASLSEALQWK